MRVFLDAGAFIAADRGDNRVSGILELARRRGASLHSTTPVVAHVWRNGASQARLARLLIAVTVHGCDLPQAQRAGELLQANHSSDVVDAHLALLVRPNDQVLTSDPHDIGSLLASRAITASIVQV